MAILNSHGTPVVGLLKNCYRCGTEYTDYSNAGAMRVCPACKKPKACLPKGLPGQPLTRREAQICDLLTVGKFNKEIAYELHLHEGTIKTFISVILAKTGQPNRTALAIWWYSRPMKLHEADK
jgi:DNA-binding NarL/FixJ family response regulator